MFILQLQNICWPDPGTHSTPIDGKGATQDERELGRDISARSARPEWFTVRPPLSGRRARTWRLLLGERRSCLGEGGLEFGEKVEMTADISTRGTRSWLPIPASDPRPAAYSTSVAEQPSLR
ncbi:hypothetical protein ONZ51_g11740 [Trametes cubensis]|uniref:Uncharacterized protein n=1 Tax=Trametes cubensis TaxID=1111947 RepID=A0AAD7TJW4_9APHY|nr:hypothetical protein ONZ51_g11740 [Trametes cubensis]